MAEITTLARPYARAAFDVASADSKLSEWANALSAAALIAADEAVQPLLGDPALTAEDFTGLFAVSDAPEGYDNFLAVLIDNDRLAILPAIAVQYLELKAEAENALSVTVRSAVALDDAYRTKLIDRLAARFGKSIELDVQIDESLLGGAVIEAGDLVIDGSLRGRIGRLGESLAAG